MKKILIFLLLLSGFYFAAFAGDIESYKQYTIIKTTNNYVPLRDGASDNAKRFSHLEKGVKIFADEYKNNFYRVDLGLDKNLSATSFCTINTIDETFKFNLIICSIMGVVM